MPWPPTSRCGASPTAPTTCSARPRASRRCSRTRSTPRCASTRRSPQRCTSARARHRCPASRRTCGLRYPNPLNLALTPTLTPTLTLTLTLTLTPAHPHPKPDPDPDPPCLTLTLTLTLVLTLILTLTRCGLRRCIACRSPAAEGRESSTWTNPINKATRSMLSWDRFWACVIRAMCDAKAIQANISALCEYPPQS
eukprot:scaffold50362_cov44-Phaeocystis_antarctica.AAC.2